MCSKRTMHKSSETWSEHRRNELETTDGVWFCQISAKFRCHCQPVFFTASGLSKTPNSWNLAAKTPIWQHCYRSHATSSQPLLSNGWPSLTVTPAWLDLPATKTGYKSSNGYAGKLVQRLWLAHTHRNGRRPTVQDIIQRLLLLSRVRFIEDKMKFVSRLTLLVS